MLRPRSGSDLGLTVPTRRSRSVRQTGRDITRRATGTPGRPTRGRTRGGSGGASAAGQWHWTGAVVPLAGGTPHTVRNEFDRDAVAFVVHAPGAPMEGFAGAVAALDGEPGMDDVPAVAARNGIEMLGPIPEESPRDGTAVTRPTVEGVFNR